MLRRVARNENSESWLLIPQIEHARLSGALAEAWGDTQLAALEPTAEILAAIAHHDDGWADWDAAPDVDPVLGRPLSFVEMPLESAVDIWRRSIYLARSRGPLAAHMVSNHFTELLQRASSNWSTDPVRFETSRRFLDEQSDHRETWLAEWQRGNPPLRTRKMAAKALAYLQFFDALSLWLCAAERSEPQTFDSPEGYEMTIAPRGPLRFTIRPWPMMVGRLARTVPARRIPARRYASRAELAANPGETVELTFELFAEG